MMRVFVCVCTVWVCVCVQQRGEEAGHRGSERAGQHTCSPGAGDPHPLGVQVDWDELQIPLSFAAAGLKRGS